MCNVQQVIDLQMVAPAELEGLWQREIQLWRNRLFWDVSDRVDTLRWVLQRRGVQGVALRIGARTVGYAYFVVSGRLGVLAGLDMTPDGASAGAGAPLVLAVMQALQQHDITRIESPFISFDSTWLPAAFETAGFRTYWREFLRIDVDAWSEPERAPSIHLEPWQHTHLPAAAALMHAAYDGEADTETNLLYRTERGCRLVLEHLLYQRNSGVLIEPASACAYHRGKRVGFILITEIAPQQGHLAQVAVHPTYQRQGVGRLLLTYSLSQLAALAFDTLSLIVSQGNERAFRLYQTMGFQSVLTFPVFVWERAP